MTELIDNYLIEYSKIADDFLKKEGSVAEKNYSFFKNFYKKEYLETIEWKDLQAMGGHLHSFTSMALARANALGKPNQSIEKYREALLYLVYGIDPIDIKVNNIRLGKGYNLPYFGRSALSELACYTKPEENLFINSRNIKAAKFLGIEILYPRNSKAGDKHLAFNNAVKPLIESYKSIVGKRTTSTIPLEVDQFLSWVYINYVPNTKEVTDDNDDDARHLLNEEFNYDRFHQDCQRANLIFQSELCLRFVASLTSKQFVILTGLAGSGKTKLAISFANWITDTNIYSSSTKFFIGEEIKSNRVSYLVIASDRISVTLEQSESGTKVSLPYDLIYEWIESIKSNDFTLETSPRKIRESVEITTKFSLQLNSFETHLKSAAFHLISKTSNSNKKRSVCVVAVGADWTTREPLLGYPNALVPKKYILPENQILQLVIDAMNDPLNPYFLILDEMNLSHVERYFADFLSAMESGEAIPLHSGESDWDGIPPSIKLPENLFIVGTVNIDETTYMFSPKVLDRANVIEFRVTEAEMRQYLNSNAKLDLESLRARGASMAASFVALATDSELIATNTDQLRDELLKFFVELKKSGAEFGYRSASEINRFVAVVNKLEPGWSQAQIMDAAIMQKLLPKVHGSRKKLEPVLKKLGELSLHDPSVFADYIKNGESTIASEKIKYPVSMEKIGRMYRALLENSFTSYAEA